MDLKEEVNYTSYLEFSKGVSLYQTQAVRDSQMNEDPSKKPPKENVTVQAEPEVEECLIEPEGCPPLEDNSGEIKPYDYSICYFDFQEDDS